MLFFYYPCQCERETLKCLQWNSLCFMLMLFYYFVYKHTKDMLAINILLFTFFFRINIERCILMHIYTHDRQWKWAKYLPLLVALTYADERLFKPVVGCWSFVPGGKMRDKLNIVLNRSVTLMSSFAEHSKTFTLFKWRIQSRIVHKIRRKKKKEQTK